MPPKGRGVHGACRRGIIGPVSRSILLAVLGALAACGGTSAAAMPTSTTAPLAGAACSAQGQPCRCAEDGESLGDVPAGKKRFEVRMTQVSDSETAVTIGGIGTLLRPSGLQGDKCFYVDLTGGQTYPVTVHGRGKRRERGLAIGYSIREYNPAGETPGMYTIVGQQCGDATSVCPHDDAGDWAAEYQVGRGGWDPCSSTRVESYQASGGFYDRHATDVDITFGLKVYQFVPRRAPGEQGCGGAP